jgi:hypothetical protein
MTVLTKAYATHVSNPGIFKKNWSLAGAYCVEGPEKFNILANLRLYLKLL